MKKFSCLHPLRLCSSKLSNRFNTFSTKIWNISNGILGIKCPFDLESPLKFSFERKKKSHKDLIQRCSAQSVSVKCSVRHQLKKAAHNWCHITTACVVSALIFLKMYIIRFVGLVLIFCCLPGCHENSAEPGFIGTAI